MERRRGESHVYELVYRLVAHDEVALAVRPRGVVERVVARALLEPLRPGVCAEGEKEAEKEEEWRRKSCSKSSSSFRHQVSR